MNLIVFASIAAQIFTSTTETKLCSDANTVASSYNYSVYFESKKVGTLNASKSVKGKIVSYSLVSNVKVNVLKEFNILEKINEEFKDDKLQNSIHTRHVNLTQKANNKAQRCNNCYKLSSNDKFQDSLTQWITQTALTLYFKEPSDKQIIYSQNFLKLFAIKKLKAGVYELPLPGGKKATYHYVGGKLNIVESSSFYGAVKFVLE